MHPFLEDRKGLLVRRMKLALEIVKIQPEVDQNKIAAIGYCFGGMCVLDLARSGVDIRGVVSFHGLLHAPDEDNVMVKAKILVLNGHDDPMASAQDAVTLANEMTKRGADWQLHSYGNTAHAFTNPDANDPKMGVKYNPVAARRSWQSMRNFLEEIFQ